MNRWELLNTISTKNIKEEKEIKKELTQSLIISYLLQHEETILIAKYISEKIKPHEIYNSYLYALSLFPNIDHKWNKRKNIDDVLLISSIFKSDINDSLNILKGVSNSELKIIKREIKILEENNIKVNDFDATEYFLNILDKNEL